MKKMKIFLPFAVAALALGLGACGEKTEAGSSSNEQSVSSTQPQPRIAVTAAGATELLINGTVKLNADVEGVSWKSNDAKIAEVDAQGNVTAKGYGEVRIVASKDGYKDGNILIKVVRPAPTKVLSWDVADHYSADGEYSNGSRSADDPSEPYYSKSSASEGKCLAYFGDGDKETLTFTASKAVKAELLVVMGHNSSYEPLSEIISAKFNGTDIDLSKTNFTSDSDGSGNYTFIGVSFGTHDLKAENNVLEISMKGNAPYLDDLNIYAESAVEITAVPAPAKEQIVITNEEASLTIEAESTVQLTSATTGLSYRSSNEDVATVSETGLVTGVAKGNATIIVSKDGMKSARVAIKVTEKLAVGEIRAEAESGTVGGVAIATADTDILQRPTSTGETCTAQWKAGAILVIKFTGVAGSYKMYLNGRAGGQYGMSDVADLAAVIEVKVNNAAVTIPADTAITGRSFIDTLLGNVTLINGENTIEVKALGEENDVAPNIDFFKFVPNA